MKISPSKIINYYYPMPEIDEEVLIKAGERGNEIHLFIEREIKGEGYNFDNRKLLYHEKEFEKIELLYNSAKSLLEDNEFKAELLEGKLDKHPKIKGYLDFYGKFNNELCIIDWKTNAKIGEEELEKYTVQMNLYRYMLSYEKKQNVENMKLIHIKKNKTRNRYKVYDIKKISDEKLEEMINEVYDYYRKVNND